MLNYENNLESYYFSIKIKVSHGIRDKQKGIQVKYYILYTITLYIIHYYLLEKLTSPLVLSFIFQS